MSLLMQALKKAEQSKQKQSALAAEASLSSADAVPATLTMAPTSLSTSSPIMEVVAKTVEGPEIVDSIATSHVQNGLSTTFANAEAAGLSLSPQTEVSAIESGSAALQADNPEAIFSSASDLAEMASPVHAVSPSFEPIESASMPASGDLVQTIKPSLAGNVEHSPQQARAKEDVNVEERKPVEVPNPEGKERPRVDPRQSELAAQADAERASEREKAKSVFSSKSPATKTRHRWLVIFGGFLAIALGGGLYVFWNSYVAEVAPLPVRSQAIQPASSETASDGTAASDSTSSQSASSQSASSQESPQSTSESVKIKHPSSASNKEGMQSNSANPQKLTADTSPVDSSVGGEKIGATKLSSQSNRSAPKSEVSSHSRSKAPSTGLVDISNGIEIRKSQSGDQLNPALSSAYLSFTSGDVIAAEQQYQIVLRQEPNNRDALLGLAAIALNQRQAERAGAFYGKLLELDPSDPEAIAGLTSLQQGDPVQSESRLKKALNQSPHSGAILFALGNLYAQQSRWSDAQQSYFRAYDTAPSNADYAFNLAVSLDRLNQAKLAKDYYQKALSLTQTGPGNFSRNSVQKRIKEIDLPSVE